MRSLVAFAAAVAAAATAAAGCSGDIAFDEYLDATETARCIYFERCGFTASRDHCLAYYAHLAFDNPSTEAAYDAGKLAYDATAARACVDAFGVLSCDATQQSPEDLAVCLDVLTGTLEIGEACGFDLECTSNNCAMPACPDACCIGTCGPPVSVPRVGEPCTSTCEQGAFCDAGGTCIALLPAGAACNDEICTYGHYCKGLTPTTSGSCAPYPHVGEPCESGCAEINAACIGGRCTEYRVLGESCSAAMPCSQFYTCANGTCALLPTRGMACDAYCSDESWCNSGTCEAQKPNGSTCARNDECFSHYCGGSGVTGTCGDVALCF